MTKRALITGITGQDGSYLAAFLLEKGYEVHGMVRRSSTESFERIEHLAEPHSTAPGRSAGSAVAGESGAQGPAARSLQPGRAELRAHQLAAAAVDRRVHGAGRHAGAGGHPAGRSDDPLLPGASSEMFGRVREEPQNEQTPFWPRSPYGVAKVYGHFITVNYRESYGMFACSGILFNHESPLRGKEFVTRKITDAVARIKLGVQDKLQLGNLDAERDWGFAGDFVRAMWLMLQQDEPDDYVIATGQKHTVRELVDWPSTTWGSTTGKHVEIDPSLYRPAEVSHCAATRQGPPRARLGTNVSTFRS